MVKKKPILIGICGPSTSGKSTLANSLSKKLDAEVIEADNFLLAKPKRRVRGYTSWESPKSMMLKEFKQSVKDIRNGKIIIIPSKKMTEIFDKKIYPKQIIIVEGFLLFHDKFFSNIFDLKLFIDIPFEKVIQRRVDYCGEEERDYCEKVVIPEHLIYREKMISNSDYILDGNKTKSQIEREALKIIKDKLNLSKELIKESKKLK
jgi:uridine kinase